MNSLNVSKFLFVYEYQERDLKFLLNAVYKCYLKILGNEAEVSKNENDIRDLFISENYLENHEVKSELGVVEFQFDKEIETDDGRVDIRIFSMINKMKGIDKPYYFIECKIIKGDKTYNDYYIKNGINRFIQEKYPAYLESNAMIGFVINKINISENTTYFKDLLPLIFIEGFEFSYESNHKTTSHKKIKLYHLMFDFSSKIKN